MPLVLRIGIVLGVAAAFAVVPVILVTSYLIAILPSRDDVWGANRLGELFPSERHDWDGALAVSGSADHMQLKCGICALYRTNIAGLHLGCEVAGYPIRVSQFVLYRWRSMPDGFLNSLPEPVESALLVIAMDFKYDIETRERLFFATLDGLGGGLDGVVSRAIGRSLGALSEDDTKQILTLILSPSLSPGDVRSGRPNAVANRINDVVEGCRPSL